MLSEFTRLIDSRIGCTERRHYPDQFNPKKHQWPRLRVKTISLIHGLSGCTKSMDPLPYIML